jgi:hypothetical protein
MGNVTPKAKKLSSKQTEKISAGIAVGQISCLNCGGFNTIPIYDNVKQATCTACNQQTQVKKETLKQIFPDQY